MSDPFTRFGIRHLSASSLNAWRGSPALWALKYLWSVREDAGPKAWRGTAVEAGLEAFLRFGRKDGALEAATAATQQTFEANAQGDLSEEVETERAALNDYLTGALAGAFPLLNKELVATQLRTELWLDRIPVPVIGYADFVFGDASLIDLKTTLRIPSEPKPEHARQVAIYMAASENTGGLLYVSPKKFTPYQVEDRDQHIRALTRDAQSLMWFLRRCEDKADAIRSLPADVDHYTWSDLTRNRLFEILDGAA